MKLIFSALTFFFVSTPLICQHVITGIVVDQYDNSPMYGIEIIEDSLNHTLTDTLGHFSIEVSQLPTTLEFTFAGMLAKKVQINADTTLTVTLKPYTLVHYFGSQKFGIFLQSGIINTPIGGKLYLTSPYFFNSRLLKSSYTYQSNLDNNKFIGASLTLENIVFNRDFGAGLSTTYQDVTFNQYQLTNKAIEIDLRSRYVPIDLSVGFSKLDINSMGNAENYNGLTITVSRYFSNMLEIEATSKLLFYNDLNGLNLQIEKRFNRFWSSISYQQLDSYSEFSIGIGYLTTYILNDPNTY